MRRLWIELTLMYTTHWVIFFWPFPSKGKWKIDLFQRLEAQYEKGCCRWNLKQFANVVSMDNAGGIDTAQPVCWYLNVAMPHRIHITMHHIFMLPIILASRGARHEILQAWVTKDQPKWPTPSAPCTTLICALTLNIRGRFYAGDADVDNSWFLKRMDLIHNKIMRKCNDLTSFTFFCDCWTFAELTGLIRYWEWLFCQILLINLQIYNRNIMIINQFKWTNTRTASVVSLGFMWRG